MGERPNREAQIAEMRLWGMPEQDIAQWAEGQPDEDDTCWMLPENEAAIKVFARLTTQRLYPPMGGKPVGFRYEGVEACLRMLGESPVDLFPKLQIMEAAMIAYYGERQ